MIRRTGARSIQVRYQDDDQPTVWMVVAEHVMGKDGLPLPAPRTGRTVHTVDCGLTAPEAAMRVCERLIDGGTCAHCFKPTAFDHGFDGSFLDATLCWTQWDPELSTFRRQCEEAAA